MSFKKLAEHVAYFSMSLYFIAHLIVFIALLKEVATTMFWTILGEKTDELEIIYFVLFFIWTNQLYRMIDKRKGLSVTP